MKKLKTILLICLFIFIAGCGKENKRKQFILLVEAFDAETKVPLVTKIHYSLPEGKISACRFREKGMNLTVTTKSKDYLEVKIYSDGYENKQITVRPGETTKKIYLNKLNKTANK